MATICLFLSGCAGTDAPEKPTKKETLVIGSDIYSPYFYLEDNGNFAGIDVEIAREGREADYAWAGSYMYSRQVVVVKVSSDIRTLKDLNGKYIAVQNASKPDKLFPNDAVSGVSGKKSRLADSSPYRNEGWRNASKNS